MFVVGDNLPLLAQNDRGGTVSKCYLFVPAWHPVSSFEGADRDRRKAKAAFNPGGVRFAFWPNAIDFILLIMTIFRVLD